MSVESEYTMWFTMHQYTAKGSVDDKDEIHVVDIGLRSKLELNENMSLFYSDEHGKIAVDIYGETLYLIGTSALSVTNEPDAVYIIAKDGSISNKNPVDTRYLCISNDLKLVAIKTNESAETILAPIFRNDPACIRFSNNPKHFLVMLSDKTVSYFGYNFKRQFFYLTSKHKAAKMLLDPSLTKLRVSTMKHGHESVESISLIDESNTQDRPDNDKPKKIAIIASICILGMVFHPILLFVPVATLALK
jgi:hypothetical protein